ncbi:hypothetical protein [Mesorhizobium sp. SP-1A]|uniref:hypothetical protein n=1 Tax=Mesorhizobium sp. SP-1A TaxID=3077840 RepID=UPI0028F71C35|nr:hypothetical protein [Mesorhizobium sp. SP-1A]
MTRGVHLPVKGPNMEAREFLETVALGHIQIDQWVKGVDGDGKAIVERPWLTLASDIHTRSILAVVISFEPPSILTLLESLGQIVRPKEWLKTEFGGAMAASVRGMPRTLVVGHEWAQVGVSFYALCEAAGIDLVFAPLKTLEYKGHVERLLRTITEKVFHRLPGAIRHKPLEMSERELDPRSEDLLTLEELRDRLWCWACTDYSMRMHRGIGMAPSRALKLSLEQNGRPIIDDIHSLDDLMGQIARMRRSVVHVTMSAKAAPKTLANGHPQRVRRRGLSPRFG